MSVLEQNRFTLSVPLREDPPGVFRVGKTRVLLELVIGAYRRGASPEDIVGMYDTLELRDVFAVLARSLAHPAQVDEYLCKADKEADELRGQIEAGQRAQPGKEELLARAKARGLAL